MHWAHDGEAIEMTSGHSMDDAIGAIRAMASCSNRDGYTMGRNEAALKQSYQDLYRFLQEAWGL